MLARRMVPGSDGPPPLLALPSLLFPPCSAVYLSAACQHPAYFNKVTRLLPQLEVLDGESLRIREVRPAPASAAMAHRSAVVADEKPLAYLPACLYGLCRWRRTSCRASCQRCCRTRRRARRRHSSRGSKVGGRMAGFCVFGRRAWRSWI